MPFFAPLSYFAQKGFTNLSQMYLVDALITTQMYGQKTLKKSNEMGTKKNVNMEVRMKTVKYFF